jgi:hypothetical protein
MQSYDNLLRLYELITLELHSHVSSSSALAVWPYASWLELNLLPAFSILYPEFFFNTL